MILLQIGCLTDMPGSTLGRHKHGVYQFTELTIERIVHIRKDNVAGG